jgi:DNA-binding MarR family transcriptional regulator
VSRGGGSSPTAEVPSTDVEATPSSEPHLVPDDGVAGRTVAPDRADAHRSGVVATGPPPGTSPSSWLLMRFSTQMHAASSRFASRQDLHATDVTAMAVLAASGGELTAGDLARELELSSGATTRLVDRLERLGHLARVTDPADRRRRRVSVTPTASATAGAYFGQLGARVEQVLATFDEDERAVIERFLGALTEAMDDLPDA